MPRLSKYHDVTKDLNPDDYTMEEIQKQMAIYNRLYYLKNLQKEGWMENKIEQSKKAYRQKAIKEYIEKQNIDIDEIKTLKNYLTSSQNEILNNIMLFNIINYLDFFFFNNLVSKYSTRVISFDKASQLIQAILS